MDPSFANNAWQPEQLVTCSGTDNPVCNHYVPADPIPPLPGQPAYIQPYIFTNSPPELPIGGAGPGGYVTGIASIKGQAYAVSDRGGFYHVYYDPASLNRDAHMKD